MNLLRHENECNMEAVDLILSQECIYSELCSFTMVVIAIKSTLIWARLVVFRNKALIIL